MNIELARRIIIAGRLYAELKYCFAHWEDVPELDLDAAFGEYVGEIKAIEDRRWFDLASMRFLARFRNSHTYFADAWLRREYGQPFDFQSRRIGGNWLITKSSRRDLPVGSEILRIDEQPFHEFFALQQPYIAASREQTVAEMLFHRGYLFPRSFRLSLDSSVTVTVDRSAALAPPVNAPTFLERDTIGILRLPSFSPGEHEAFAIAQILAASPGVPMIIDLRGNMGGVTPMALVEALMDRPFRTWIEATPQHTGLGSAAGLRPEILLSGPETIAPKVGAFRGKLALLIDGACLSATEDFVAPFKDNHRATIVGERTGGSSGQPVNLDLGDGMTAAIGAKRQWFPDGAPFEGVGIEPDITVLLTRDDILSGSDVALETAISCLS